MAEKREVVIVGAARTPIGAFLGSLSTLPAPKLGAAAIKAAVERSGVKPEEIDLVIMGNVLQAGVGQAPARQAALFAGLPERIPAVTLNKVCGSGLEAVIQAARAILVGDAEVAVAGGMESMSNAPYLSYTERRGARMGDVKLVDAMIKDGLWDVYGDHHMGIAGEACAESRGITRGAQDEYATESTRRAIEAQKAGAFVAEIVPVEVPGKKGEITVVSEDEGPKSARPEKIPTLKPAFKKDGTITAANASSINDGAAAVVLMTKERALAEGREILATVTSWGHAARKPIEFTVAPADAMRNALAKAGLEVKDIDLFEVNEAFAVVAIANNDILGLDPAKVNVNGGAVCLGHPIGASGTRILVTLLYAMKARDAKRGMASLCIGGGEGVALIVERA